MANRSFNRFFTWMGHAVLVSLLLGMFCLNDLMVRSAYSHENAYRLKPVLLSDWADCFVYRAMHFLLPINPLNYLLWTSKSQRDGVAVCVFTFLFLASIAILFWRHKGRIWDPLLFGCGMILLAALVFERTDSAALFALNCVLYGVSIFCVSLGMRRQKSIFFFCALFCWLVPNLYQSGFLVGLSI